MLFRKGAFLVVAGLLTGGVARSQVQSTPLAAISPSAVPALVPYSGIVVAADGKHISGERSATFLIYKEEQGGEPLWSESQTIAVDATGHYKAQLGATYPDGLPLDLFATGDARWLEVQIAGEQPQARVLLASVPYALKAAEASTLGGLPASAFVRADQRANSAAATAIPAGVNLDVASNVTTTGGTAGYVPAFNGAATVIDSPIFVDGANVGIGTAAPTAPLTVNGATLLDGAMTVTGNSTYYGSLVMPSINIATATNSYASNFIKLQTSAYNSATKSVVSPRFQWQALVTGNNTPTPGATLNLYASTGTAAPTPTGFYFKSDGTINFAPGQTFPGTGAGNGTITAVTAGTALTGGGASGAVTLNLDTSKVPLLAAANSFTGNQSVTGNISASGSETIQGAGSFGTGGKAINGLSGMGIAIGLGGQATGTANNSAGVSGKETATTGVVYGVSGSTSSTTNFAAGVNGFEGAASGQVYGVEGSTASSTSGAIGVLGFEAAGSGVVIGVDGIAVSATAGATGVSGFENSGTGFVFGMFGQSASSEGIGVFGNETSNSGPTVGVQGVVASNQGVSGRFINATGSGLILQGLGNSGSVFQVDTSGNGVFAGNLTITGSVSKGGGSFKIDDPLDPANKYLSHSFVESPDMMNVYNGNVTTDKRGRAVVELPAYFESLNRDFRYQLTVMGQFAQAIIDKKVGATKIGHNRFVIRTNKPSVEVSWQVTGIRKDAYANANRIPEEEEKPETERGYYLHPEAFGQPASKGIVAAGRSVTPANAVARLSGNDKP